MWSVIDMVDIPAWQTLQSNDVIWAIIRKSQSADCAVAEIQNTQRIAIASQVFIRLVFHREGGSLMTTTDNTTQSIPCFS